MSVHCSEIIAESSSPVLYKPSASIYYSEPIGLTARKLMNTLLLEGQRVQKHDPDYKPGDYLKLDISLSDVLESISWGRSRNISYVKDILTSLAGTTISWDNQKLDNNAEWGVCSLLSHALITKGRVKVTINPEIADKLQSPILYAKVHVIAANKMRKKNSILLYEMLLDLKGRKQNLTIPLDRLLNTFQLAEDFKYKYLVRNELKPACTEINEHTDIFVSYSAVKEGRNTVAVTFSVKNNTSFQLALDLQEEVSSEHGTQQLLNDLVSRKVHENVALELIRKYPANRIRHNIREFDNSSSTGSIRNPGAWLKTAIERNYTTEDALSESNAVVAHAKSDKQHTMSDTELKELYQQHRYSMAWRVFGQKTKSFQSRHKNLFLKRMQDTNNQMVLKKISANDWDNQQVRGHLMTDELIDKLLGKAAHYSFDAFKKSQQEQSTV